MFDHTQYRRPLPQGVQLEQLAEHAFRDGGFLAERSSILDTKYAVDFLVTKCMRLYLPMPRQILVQITCKVNDTAKFLNFAKKAKQLQPNAARLYIEVKEENRQLHFHRFPFIAALDRLLTDTDLQNESLFRVYVEGFFSRFQVIHSLADFKRNVLPTSRRRSGSRGRQDELSEDLSSPRPPQARDGGRRGRTERPERTERSERPDPRVTKSDSPGRGSSRPTRVSPTDRNEKSDSRTDEPRRGSARRTEPTRERGDSPRGESRPRSEPRGRRTETQGRDSDSGATKESSNRRTRETTPSRADSSRTGSSRAESKPRTDRGRAEKPREDRARDDKARTDEPRGRSRETESTSEPPRGRSSKRGRRGRGRSETADVTEPSEFEPVSALEPSALEPVAPNDPEDYDWDLFDTSTSKTRNEGKTPLRERKKEEPTQSKAKPEPKPEKVSRPRKAELPQAGDPDFFDWDGDSATPEIDSSVESIKAKRRKAEETTDGAGSDDSKSTGRGSRSRKTSESEDKPKTRTASRPSAKDDSKKKSDAAASRPRRSPSPAESDFSDFTESLFGDEPKTAVEAKKSNRKAAPEESSEQTEPSRGGKKKASKKKAAKKKKTSGSRSKPAEAGDSEGAESSSRASGYLRIWNHNPDKPAQEFGVAYDSDGAEFYCHQRSFADRDNLTALRKHVAANASGEEPEVMVNIPVSFRPGRRRRTDGRFSALEVTADEV